MSSQYPEHLIDPRKKDKSWVKDYIKAAWNDFNGMDTKAFYSRHERYQEIKDYAQGRQSIQKYKPLLGVDKDASQSWMAINWDVLPIVDRFRRVALNRIGKMGYNLVVTPIDSVAETEKNKYFAKQKAKITMREEMAKMGQDPSQFPELMPGADDPEDMEELKIQQDWTWKHNMAIEMETAIELIYDQNDVDELLRQADEDIIDFGVAGFREYIDSNGSIKIRKVDIPSLVVSYCEKRNFSDLQHVGEVVSMTISDLKQRAGDQFTEEDYKNMAKSVAGKFGNPRHIPGGGSHSYGYDSFKIRILDMEFFSVDERVYEKRINKRGNLVIGKTEYKNRNKSATAKKTYERVAYKVVYKGCWVIETDYIFDAGLCTNMERVKSNLMDTKTSFHLYSPSFYKMQIDSIMEQLIPIADAIQLAWYRIQHTIAEAVPKGMMIDMDALDEVSLGSGGKDLTPKEVISLYKQKGVLVFRSRNLEGDTANYAPIREIENGVSSDLERYVGVINYNMGLIRSIIGLNELTDGSTPDARTLTTTANLAEQGSNNSLYGMVVSRKKLLESMAASTIVKLQDIMSSGSSSVKGYVEALGSGTKKWFELSPKVTKHEFGFKLEDKPSDVDRQRLEQMLMAKLGEGFVELEDVFFIKSIDNVKMAEQVLSHRIKKRKAQKQEESMRLQEANGAVQAQAAQAAEQAKQQTLQLEYQLKMELAKLEGQIEIDKMLKEKEADKDVHQLNAGVSIAKQAMQQNV